MSALPNHSLQRFEDYKDNPMVQALTEFITSTLAKRLDEVKSWSIECSDLDFRDFHLALTDDTRIKGTLGKKWNEEGWRVHSFQYVFTVVGNIPSFTFSLPARLNKQEGM